MTPPPAAIRAARTALQRVMAEHGEAAVYEAVRRELSARRRKVPKGSPEGAQVAHLRQRTAAKLSSLRNVSPETGEHGDGGVPF